MLPLSTSHLEELANVAVIVAAVATVGLLLVAVWAGLKAAAGVRAQIEEQRRIERRRRAYAHLSTFTSYRFTEMSIETFRVFQRFDDGDPAEIWKDVSESEEAAIQTVLNSYEEIANEYNAGFLDQQAAEPLVFLATIAWQQGHELIEWLRQGDPRYLDQWETLYLNAPPDLRPEPA